MMDTPEPDALVQTLMTAVANVLTEGVSRLSPSAQAGLAARLECGARLSMHIDISDATLTAKLTEGARSTTLFTVRSSQGEPHH